MNHIIATLFIRVQNGTHRVGERAPEQRGATTVEYVMILGIMALLVAAIFLLPGLGLSDRISGLGSRVQKIVGDIT